jgi:hypothetical protein
VLRRNNVLCPSPGTRGGNTFQFSCFLSSGGVAFKARLGELAFKLNHLGSRDPRGTIPLVG